MKEGLPVSKMLICIIFLPFMAFAQNSVNLPASYSAVYLHGGDDRISSNVPLNEINIHAYRHFKKRYPQVEGENWLKINDEYIVSFIDEHDTMHAQAHFDKHGNFLYSVKFYAETTITPELKDAVLKKYPDYLIDVVTEVTDGEKTFYLIKIENSSSVKTLILNDGRMDVYEELVNGGINSRLVRN